MNLIYRLSPRLHLWCCYRWYGFRYGPVSNAINAFYFLSLAWGFLCGKWLIITTEKPVSNGGYKYLSIIISKRPVSSLHTYD